MHDVVICSNQTVMKYAGPNGAGWSNHEIMVLLHEILYELKRIEQVHPVSITPDHSWVRGAVPAPARGGASALWLCWTRASACIVQNIKDALAQHEMAVAYIC